jgi:hypothetical protein
MMARSHDAIKALIQRYRDRAAEFCAAAREMDHGLPLTVPARTPVQLTEDGAFVEVSLWIPQEDLG